MYCERCMTAGFGPEQMFPTPEGRLVGPCCAGNPLQDAPPQEAKPSILDRPVSINIAFNPQQGMKLNVESGSVSVNVTKSAQEVQSWLQKYVSWTQGKQTTASPPPPPQPKN